MNDETSGFTPFARYVTRNKRAFASRIFSKNSRTSARIILTDVYYERDNVNLVQRLVTIRIVLPLLGDVNCIKLLRFLIGTRLSISKRNDEKRNSIGFS